LQTTQSIPLDAFRFRCTKVLAADRLSSVGACNIPMHFIGQLPSGSGPKDRTE